MPDPVWVEKMRTELIYSNMFPIYLDTYQFSAPDYRMVKIKIEIYHQYGLERNLDRMKPKSEMLLVGESVFSMDELLKTSMSILKQDLSNRTNKSLEKRMSPINLNSKIVLRYEEVEQTNELITFQFRIKEFETKTGIRYVLYRNRSLGEFVKVFESERKKNNRIEGTLFKEVELPTKEIVRNDHERLIKLEVYQCKKRGTDILLGEAEFSVEAVRKSKTKLFSCFFKKQLVGRV